MNTLIPKPLSGRYQLLYEPATALVFGEQTLYPGDSRGAIADEVIQFIPQGMQKINVSQNAFGGVLGAYMHIMQYEI